MIESMILGALSAIGLIIYKSKAFDSFVKYLVKKDYSWMI